MSVVDEIYQIFVEYYGEDNVDKQINSIDNSIKLDGERYNNCSIGDTIILVHWPTVTVTNEYGGHVDIWDLYSATVLSPEGKLKSNPFFNRSTYDSKQWLSDFLHSHVAGIHKTNLSLFVHSCLGTGPIRETIAKLQESQYTDMDIWRLYCWELDKYVRVESLIGGPYRKLQNIGIDNSGREVIMNAFLIAPTFPDLDGSRNKESIISLFKQFITKVLKDDILKFAYFEGTYKIASTYKDTVLTLSNAFIDMYNSSPALRKSVPKTELFGYNYIIETNIVDGTIYIKQNNTDVPIEGVLNTFMFRFKDKDVTLQIKGANQKYNVNKVFILNTYIIDFIIFTLLKYVNLFYGKSSDTINKKVRVI